jgi:hypothetical protein
MKSSALNTKTISKLDLVLLVLLGLIGLWTIAVVMIIFV